MMLSVDEALDHILAGAEPLDMEAVPLADAYERVLARDIAATLTQPPFPASAMDGYAVRRADLGALPARLNVIGESAAGHPFSGPIGDGEAVRIFTGGVVPDGADHIVIQENTAPVEGAVEIREAGDTPYIRPRGGDFAEGDVLLRAGRRLTARDLLLAAQTNYAELPVRRRPKMAILATGDELVAPGGELADGQIISSIPAGLSALARKAGAAPLPLGIVTDSLDDLEASIARAREADVLVTIGGASVGDHDLVRDALEAAGYEIRFHKIAMRPGKPLMSGRHPDGRRVVGLPGNPVSAMICGLIFLRPLIAALTGEARAEADEILLPLASPLSANGPRKHYMRARLHGRGAEKTVEPFPSQDSSLTATLAAADCLIVSEPQSPARPTGALVPVMLLDL